jgi:hypothetical protein
LVVAESEAQRAKPEASPLSVFLCVLGDLCGEQKKALDLVKQGWFRDEQDIFYEAIRRYLDSYRPDLMEKFIRDDVEWGLHNEVLQ